MGGTPDSGVERPTNAIYLTKGRRSLKWSIWSRAKSVGQDWAINGIYLT